jgi:quinoprotein relay system zinc metallohydrolase 2
MQHGARLMRAAVTMHTVASLAHARRSRPSNGRIGAARPSSGAGLGDASRRGAGASPARASRPPLPGGRRARALRALVAVAGLMALGAGAFPGGAAAAESLPVTEVAPGVFVHTGVHEDIAPSNHGDIANIGFIVGQTGVAVIDTGNTRALGERLKLAVREKTDLPIRYVINTHVHPDHIFGNAAFKGEGVQFVGHEKLARAMTERAPFYLETLKTFMGADAAAGIEVVTPTLTVSIGAPIELDLGGRTLTVTAYPPAHTRTDITVLDNKTETLWSGDLVFLGRTPSLDGSLLGWIKVIGELRKVKAARVVPGHGPASAPWPQALDDEARYFGVLLRDVRAVLKKGGTIEEAIKTAGQEEKGKWALFDDYNARNVTEAFTELEWE